MVNIRSLKRKIQLFRVNPPDLRAYRPLPRDASFSEFFFSTRLSPGGRWILTRIQYFYMERLASGGRWLIFPTFVFLYFGASSLNMQSYIPFLYCAALWVVSILAAMALRPKVSIRWWHAGRVCAGEAIAIEFEVQQNRRLGGEDLFVVAHHLPLEIELLDQGGVRLPPLYRGKTVHGRLRLKCHRRGVYCLHGMRVESDFPFGVVNSAQTCTKEESLLVFPHFTPLANLSIPSGLRYQPGGVAMAATIGEAFEYAGNREYREGDNVRNIDWRATARLHRPIVREYREEYFLRVAVVLDTYVPRGAGTVEVDAFERAVSICAAVGDYMARQEYIVDIFAAGGEIYHLTAGRSLAYLDQILDILACVDESRTEPFVRLEPEIAENLDQINALICIFLDWTESRRSFAHRLGHSGAALKVIIVRDGRCTLDPVADEDLIGPVSIISQEAYRRGVTDL